MDNNQRMYHGVMVSSTFTDLKKHRSALIKAIKANQFTDVSMENDSAKTVDVIKSSLDMVRHSSAYIGVIGKKYGQTPECADRNPDKLSITELEFNEARRLKRPILLFIMGDDHPIKESDVELNARKRKKLKAFVEKAKKMQSGSKVNRVYAVFNSLEDFIEKATVSLSELRVQIDTKSESRQTTNDNQVPKSPAFYAKPDYIGSHRFVGRKAELETLNEWAEDANPYTMLLFEAIGGNGKSMLTWEWIINHALNVRKDWKGRMWYSFYEKGATMADFCRHALTYITGSRFDDFEEKKTAELIEPLIAHLKNDSYLIVLDGLERVLVEYHRFDFAEIPDEEVDQPMDKVAQRDPCDTIKPEDEELLYKLATASASKILISSRLVPKKLLNNANQAIPGVRRIPLSGLTLKDGEALLRSCNVSGDSKKIQSYLTTNCDCHPLTIGILAGLINEYLPDRGNFDTWESDPDGGGLLNLANLDLIQRRNHILKASLNALSPNSHKLISTLALISDGIDFKMLSAINPMLPSKPKEMSQPENPETSGYWKRLTKEEQTLEKKDFLTATKKWNEYQKTVKKWIASSDYTEAPRRLTEAILDLENRGLIQYDAYTKRYDLHPVVRGVVVGALKLTEREEYGKPIVDYFNSQSHSPYEAAETLEELNVGINLVRTLFKMGRYIEASDILVGELSVALIFNMEAYSDLLSLLQPYFQDNWMTSSKLTYDSSSMYHANNAGICLTSIGAYRMAFNAYELSFNHSLSGRDWKKVSTRMSNMAFTLGRINRISKQRLLMLLSMEVAELIEVDSRIFKARMDLYRHYGQCGEWSSSQKIWEQLNPMGRSWNRAVCRPGDVERYYCEVQFWKGELREEDVLDAMRLAEKGSNGVSYRVLKCLLGQLYLDQKNWSLAKLHLSEGVILSRKRAVPNSEAETQLVLAKYKLNELEEPMKVAQELSIIREPAYLALAELFVAIGDEKQASKYALKAYRHAWADGEPYIDKYKLSKSYTILQKLGTEVPRLPPYNPEKDEKLPFEEHLLAAIEELRKQKQSVTGNEESNE